MPEALIRTASHKWQPQIIIGIDFGMTCTGLVSEIELEMVIREANASFEGRIRFAGSKLDVGAGA